MVQVFLSALLIGTIHFAVPLAYYAYLRGYSHRPWNLRLDSSYIPRTTVIIPTYDECTLIETRLTNIKAQIFPKAQLDVIVVDSGSTDGTVETVKRWIERNPDVKVTLVTKPVRRGKAEALNTALGSASGDIVVLTDADAEWTDKSLRNAVSYFSDKLVGAVTGVKEPTTSNAPNRPIEFAYRRFFNLVRVAESKIYSTPIFNGELAAFKKQLLKEIGGFQTTVGADDSHAATLLSLMGFRSLAVPDVVVFELVPNSWPSYLKWKKRRALHLVQHFRILLRKLQQAPPPFRSILEVETFLHLLNPWLLVAAVAAFLISVLTEGFSWSHLGLILIIGGSQIMKRSREALRAWIIDQFILVYASVNGLFSSELIWPKIQELRNRPTRELRS